ncbi:Peptidase S8/S53 domain-containing protein, partial [Cynara cardunculus var. scolymus]
MLSVHNSQLLIFNYDHKQDDMNPIYIKALKLISYVGMDGVVSVFPSRKNKVATTRFPLKVNRSTTESDIIIGVFDTGIRPELASFSDIGYAIKIIGAQYFKANGTHDPEDIQSPRDSDGHGTHIASTAAGNTVRNANLLGLHSGTARGGVPRARIALYKVCWTNGCSDVDVLSAFDAAIADGVDIISASIGPESVMAPFLDGFSIGSFHAMMKGILTVQSAGNDGPSPQTTTSIAPWVLSVVAGTKNPDLITPVRLGNNMVVDGVSVNPFTLDRLYPLVYAGDVPNNVAGFNGSTSRNCGNNSLDKNLVQGKIILRDCLSTGEAEMGRFMAFSGPDFESYHLPVSVMNFDKANNIFQYIRSTRNATSVIMKSEDVTNASSPYVASFSSRGPNRKITNILKKATPVTNFHSIQPDLTAPGVRILAAWPPVAPISLAEGDHIEVPFNMISGTSMAFPHVSGIAAYIKSFNPTWSPSAIKSALMTTASLMSAQINTDAEFAYGAEVYDADEVDYLTFLCQQNYSTHYIRIITGVDVSCSELMKQTKDLNYPTFVIPTMSNVAIDSNFSRTVTNVGSATSTYRALLTQPRVGGLRIQVEPNIQHFEEYGQKLSFKVSVQATIQNLDNPIVSGGLTWDDGVHQVHIPIVVH